MKFNKKVLIFAGLELVALAFLFIEGNYLQQETNQCIVEYGESWQLCAPIFSSQGWPFFSYVLFTWGAFVYLVSIIYNKWIISKNSIERIIFDIVMIPLVILMPIILPALWLLPRAIWILLIY